ncbi:toxin-antitoxin system YwqK family antitoxin [Prevotella dentasini]
MSRILLFCLLFLLLPSGAGAQRYVNPSIPHGAIFYDSRWKGTDKTAGAAYYRLLTVDGEGQKMFYDYYIGGQLRAEKHYVSIDRSDDRRTVLTGLCRTFHPSGRVESIMKYRNGKADGRAVSFFPGGSVGMKLNYRNGVLDGTAYTYSEAGKLEYTTVWRNGTKVSEQRGGRDKYIDWDTNQDPFCDQYRKDEPLIMAQSESVAAAERAWKSSDETKAPKPQPSAPGAGRTHAVRESVPPRQSPNTVRGSRPQPRQTAARPFGFGYLHAIISDAGHCNNATTFYDAVGSAYGLPLSQTISGFGTQRELTYHYDMTYDAATGKDVITGRNPRQIGFFGVETDRELTVSRINLYTASAEEAMRFADDAAAAGYRPLGGSTARQTDGNCVMEHPQHNRQGDPEAVVITFTHLPALYAGLYHIRMERK